MRINLHVILTDRKGKPMEVEEQASREIAAARVRTRQEDRAKARP